jgi:hypothetical protein
LKADIASLSPESYRQQVSYCVQTPVLFGDTVYDNLIFPWQIRNKTPEPEKFIQRSGPLWPGAGDAEQIHQRAVGRRKAARLADPQPAVFTEGVVAGRNHQRAR